MKKTLFFVTSITLAISSLAQTLTPRVICTGYGSGQGGGIKLNYTVGETFVSTLRNGNTVLTQGFHQPEINPCPTPPIAANIPQNVLIECNAAIPAFDPAFYMANGSSVTVTLNESVTDDGCTATIVQEWIGVNECNDSTIVSRVVTQTDTTAPLVEGETEIELPCDDYFGVFATATDICSDIISLTYTSPEQLSSGGCAGEIVRNYIATDACGNSSEFIQIIRLVDELAPVCTNTPGNINIECGQPIPYYLPIWDDQCDSHLELNSTTSSEVNGCTTEITTTYTATDDCDNVGTVNRVITIIDATAPVFTFVPSGGTFTCDGGINFGEATAVDGCSEVSVAFIDNITQGNCPQSYTITRTWTATDECGNQATATTEYVVEDNVAPVFVTIPEVSFIQCLAELTVDYPVVTDNCGSPNLSYSDSIYSGSENYYFTVIRTWTNTDECGNVSTAIVTYFSTLGTPGNGCNDGDTCTVNDIVLADCSCAGTYLDTDSDGTCDAIDNCAGPEAGSACDDNDPCTTGDIILADCSCAGTFADADNDGTCDANDLCAGAEPGSACDDNDPCTTGDIILADCSCAGTFAGDDDNDGICNTYDSCSGLPIATLDPADLTISCEDLIPAFEPEFYMADGSELYITQTASVVYEDCTTRIIQVWTATNACNESTSVYRTVFQTDNTEPVFNFNPADVTIGCDESFNIYQHIPTATDNCSTASVSWTETRIDGDCPMNYTRQFTVTATDNCGNTASTSFNVYVVDVEDPIMSGIPADVTISCEDLASLPGVFPSASDNCSDVAITSTESILPGICPSNYTLLYTYTATDACGNSSSDEYRVEVVDFIAPVLLISGSGETVNCISELADRVFSATDNCSDVSLSQTVREYTDGTHYLIETIYNATDACGNSQTGIVIDTTLLGPIGTPCNDGFYCTVNDMINDECGCTGSFYDENGDFVCDFLQNLTINVTSLTFCPGDFVTLSINEPLTGLTYYWSNNQSGTSIEVNPTQSTTYSVYTIIDGQTVYASVDLIALPVNTFYLDGDGDGFGDPQIVRTSCEEELAEFVLNNLDCNDTSAEVYPGATCDDGNPCTINDAINGECACIGTLNLPAVGEVSAFSCGSYAWNGNVYTTSGDYEYYTPAASGCDSLTILHLTVGTPTFSNQSVTNCGSYSWNGTTYSQSGTYTYVTTNSTGCPNTATLILTVNNPSIAASSVIASTNNVSAGTSVTLTVQGGSLGTGASWKWYRSACGGSLIGTGPSITITANTTDSYFVRAEGSCNTSACASITINVLSAQCGPELVSASSTRICSGSSTTLSVVGTLYPGAIWRWRRNSCSGTIVGTGANLSVSPTATTTYFVRAEGGTCGITLCMSITIIVDKMPATPSVISGPANGLCNAQNVTYSVTPVSTVQQYNWTVPPGITIVSGQGTASVTVNVGNFINTNPTNGNPAICVTAQNSCGISPIRCLSLTTYPATPASISGPTAPCINSVNTYSCPAVFGASSYTWQVPTGWVIQSGQGTSSITVLCNGTAGNVRVRANNSCGNSTQKSMAVAPKTCGTTAMPMQLELWPNPTSDRVFFAHGDATPDHLQIYDMLGRDVYNGGWVPEFDVSGLAGGIYFVRATSGGESVVKRMEVVR